MRIIFQWLTTAMGWLGWLVALSWFVVAFGDSLYFLSFVVAVIAYAGAVIHSTRRDRVTQARTAARRACFERYRSADDRLAFCFDRTTDARPTDSGVSVGSGGDARER